MKQKIPSSAIAGIEDFAGKAAAHAVEMKNWRSQEAKVKQDIANKVPIEKAHVSYKRPKSHPMVESAVDENDEANFEIVDDGPTPDQRLAAKKYELLGQVSEAERAASMAAVPFGKRRAYAMRESDILSSEMEAREKPGFFAKLTGKTARDPSEDRSPDDIKFMADQVARGTSIAAIERAAAQAMSDIEDLTAETIGAWKLPTF